MAATSASKYITSSPEQNSIMSVDGYQMVPLRKHKKESLAKECLPKPVKKETLNKFRVATSYMTERIRTSNNFSGVSNRTVAFETLSNPVSIREKLFRTEVCRNVVPDSGGNFKTCTRDTCNFAHGLDQWKPAPCSFGVDCRFRYGPTIDRKGFNKPSCRFYHNECETIQEWSVRTCRPVPNLPPTSEHTYRPTPVAINKEVEVPFIIAPVQQNMWLKPLPPASISEDVPSSCPPDDLQVQHCIRVPTQELAEIALKAAFDRGFFDVKVIVE